jgi:hypothetical protein
MEKGKLDSESVSADLRRLVRNFTPGTRVVAVVHIFNAASGLEVTEGTGGIVVSSEGPLVLVAWDNPRGAVKLATLASHLDPEPASGPRRYRGWRSHGETYVYAFDPPTRFDDETAPPIGAEPLALRLELARHSPTGFEWGYGGSGPAQLSLAILADRWRDDDGRTERGKDDPNVRTRGELHALEHHQELKCLVGRLDGDAWELTAADIDLALECAVELVKPGMRERASKALDALARAAVWRASLPAGPCSTCGHAHDAHDEHEHQRTGPCKGKIGANADVACSCSTYRPWPAHVPVRPSAVDAGGRYEGAPASASCDAMGLPSCLASLFDAVKAPAPSVRRPDGTRLDVDKIRELVNLANTAARTRTRGATVTTHMDNAADAGEDRPVPLLAAMLRDAGESCKAWIYDDTTADQAAAFRRASEFCRAAADELAEIVRSWKGEE